MTDRLYLDHTGLTVLPESIGRLTKLSVLSVMANQLTTLPNLRKLDLRWNRLRTLPGWLSDPEARGVMVHHSF